MIMLKFEIDALRQGYLHALVMSMSKPTYLTSNKNQRRLFKTFKLTPRHSSDASMDHEKEPCWFRGTSPNGLDLADNLAHLSSYSSRTLPHSIYPRTIPLLHLVKKERPVRCDCQSQQLDASEERTRISTDEQEASVSMFKCELVTEVRRIISPCSCSSNFHTLSHLHASFARSCRMYS